MITRRDFLKVTGVAAAAAALTACGGSSSTASSAASGAASSEAASAAAKLDKIKVAVPNDTTNEARALTLLEMWTRPSLPGAISTKAPKFIRRVTLPL